jgi:hypothetical protein
MVGRIWYDLDDLTRYYQENRTSANDPARMNCWVNPSHPSERDPEHKGDERWRCCVTCQVSWYAGLQELPL